MAKSKKLKPTAVFIRGRMYYGLSDGELWDMYAYPTQTAANTALKTRKSFDLSKEPRILAEETEETDGTNGHSAKSAE